MLDSCWCSYLVPIFNVEAKVNVEVLMVVIVEDAVWLPWLPPLSFEIDTRMVEDTIAVDVGKDKRLCHCIK